MFRPRKLDQKNNQMIGKEGPIKMYPWILVTLTLGSILNVSAMVSRCFTAQAAAISKPSAILE